MNVKEERGQRRTRQERSTSRAARKANAGLRLCKQRLGGILGQSSTVDMFHGTLKQFGEAQNHL
eukprot:6209065-Pleurochrysis_carterae.AAC.7